MSRWGNRVPASSGREKQVVVTACSEPMQVILRHSLEPYNATALYIEAGPEMIARLEAEAPCLVLANIDPLLQGSSLPLGELAAVASRLSVPIIAYSEKWRDQDMAAKTRPYFETVLWAPMAIQELRNLLDGYLGHSR